MTLGVTVAGLGLWTAVGLLILMEAGVPIPIPNDLVMLAIGGRVAAGDLAWWEGLVALEIVAVVSTLVLFSAARGPGSVVVRRLGPRIGLTPERLDRASQLVERRGRVALAIGRGTPGLSARRALPPLLVGATVFAQLHLVLGLGVGPLAEELFHRAASVAVVLAVILVAAAAVFWVVHRGRRRGVQAWEEAACPVCLGLAAVVEHFAAPELERPLD